MPETEEVVMLSISELKAKYDRLYSILEKIDIKDEVVNSALASFTINLTDALIYSVDYVFMLEEVIQELLQTKAPIATKTKISQMDS